MAFFEGRGYEIGNFSHGNIAGPYPLGPGNVGHGNYGVDNLSEGNIVRPYPLGPGNVGHGNYGLENIVSGGKYGSENLNKSKCSDSIFLSPHFREAAEKLRDQVKSFEDIFPAVWRS